MSDTFGFPKRRNLAEKLDSIVPNGTTDAATDAALPVERLDDAAARHGFISREPEVAFRRDKTIGPTVTLHTRAPVRVATPFQRFCEANRYSYWEGIEELMKRAGLM